MFSKATIKLAHRVTQLSSVWQWYLIPWLFHYNGSLSIRIRPSGSFFFIKNFFTSPFPIIALLPSIVLFLMGHCNHISIPKWKCSSILQANSIRAKDCPVNALQRGWPENCKQRTRKTNKKRNCEISIQRTSFYQKKICLRRTSEYVKNTIKAGGSTARAQNVEWVMDGVGDTP